MTFLATPVLNTARVYHGYSTNVQRFHLLPLNDLTDSFKHYPHAMKTELAFERVSLASYEQSKLGTTQCKLIKFLALAFLDYLGPKSGLCSKEFKWAD